MEQDPPMDGAGELPTYQQLAAQHGPNSRFGRWQSWVEKRAAERYADDTPEKKRAREMKGWGPQIVIDDPPPDSPESLFGPQPSLSRTQTVLSQTQEKDAGSSVPATPITTVQALPPSHLQLHTFGSRFLPHSEQPILSLLPICNDSMLLMGHADGLSVLILKNEELSSPLHAEPRRQEIWRGQGVYQLEILESDSSSPSRTPQGVVLALVGTDLPESSSEKESKGPHRAIRMYSLGSLVKLARWAASRKDNECLDAVFLTQSQDTSSKRTKPRVKAQVVKQSVNSALPSSSIPPPVPPKDLSRGPIGSASSSSTRVNPVSSGWNVVDHGDLVVQWMTDYVPLASPGSKLLNQSITFFELLRSPNEGRVSARLLVATKQNMLLYEAVRGERAVRFAKEFYTPLPARSVTFIYQSSPELSLSPRSPGSTTTLGSYDSSTHLLNPLTAPSRSTPSAWPSSGQLSLFVTFEKKAGLIRVSDSAVGELDLWEAPSHSRWSSAHLTSSSSPSSSSSSVPFRLSVGSFDTISIGKESKGTWLPPAEVTFPSPAGLPHARQSLYLLTRGKITHILPSPLPVPISSIPPLKILRWESVPNRVVARACPRPGNGDYFLQAIGLSENGVEVLECSLTLLYTARRNGKTRDDTTVVYAEVGPGGAGFLRKGGHWADEASQSGSPSSLQRHSSVSTVDTMEMAESYDREEGFYAWTQKGYNDWRVFWLGGNVEDCRPSSWSS